MVLLYIVYHIHSIFTERGYISLEQCYTMDPMQLTNILLTLRQKYEGKCLLAHGELYNLILSGEAC